MSTRLGRPLPTSRTPSGNTHQQRLPDRGHVHVEQGNRKSRVRAPAIHGQRLHRIPVPSRRVHPFRGHHFRRSFKTNANIFGNNWGHFTEFGFRYTTDNLGLVDGKAEYNTHLQSFIFPASSVVSYRGSETVTTPISVASETVHHIIDDAATNIDGTHLIKQGLVTKSRSHDVDGPKGSEVLGREVVRTENEYYDPFNDPSSWPERLFVMRPKSIATTTWARNKSRQVNRVSFHKYNPYNNQAQFLKKKSGSDWYLTQKLVQTTGVNKGLSFGQTTYRFGTEPSDAALENWSLVGQPFTNDNANQKAVSASEVEFDNAYPHMVKKQKAWREADPTLIDDELKRGVNPIHNRSEGWEDRMVTDKWNRFGQPLETRTILTPLKDRKTAFFYEGRSSLPVGTVENAFLEDAAILTAENGNCDPGPRQA